MEQVAVVITAFVLGGALGATAMRRRRRAVASSSPHSLLAAAGAPPASSRGASLDLRDVAAVLDGADVVVRLGETAPLLWPDRAESELLGRRFADLFDGDNVASPVVALAESRSMGVGRATITGRDGENVRELIALDRFDDPEIRGTLIRAYRAPVHQILNDAPIRASLRRLLSMLRIAFVAIDGDRISVVNQELCSLFGLAADPMSFSGTPAVLLFHSIARLTSDPERTAATMNETSASGLQPTRIDLDLLDGRRFVATCVRASPTSPWRLWFVWERSGAQSGPLLDAPSASEQPQRTSAIPTRFIDLVPRGADAPPVRADATPVRSEAMPADAATIHFERVLAVTAEPEARVRADLLVVARHFDVTADAERALALVEAMPYDLVLLDGTMSPLDGADLTREVRRRRNGSDAAVVILTNNIAPVSSARFLAAGADAVLATPFTPADLVNAVRRVVRPDAPGVDGGRTEERGGSSADSDTVNNNVNNTVNNNVINDVADAGTSNVNATATSDRATGSTRAHDDPSPDELPAMARARGIFTSLLATRIGAIFDAFDGGDVERFVAAVHGLGSPAVMVGAERLGRYCLALETTARAAGLSAVGRTAVEQIASLGETELRSLLAAPSPS